MKKRIHGQCGGHRPLKTASHTHTLFISGCDNMVNKAIKRSCFHGTSHLLPFYVRNYGQKSHLIAYKVSLSQVHSSLGHCASNKKDFPLLSTKSKKSEINSDTRIEKGTLENYVEQMKSKGQANTEQKPQKHNNTIGKKTRNKSLQHPIATRDCSKKSSKAKSNITL